MYLDTEAYVFVQATLDERWTTKAG